MPCIFSCLENIHSDINIKFPESAQFITKKGKDFIRKLLDKNPLTRLKAGDCLKKSWFRSGSSSGEIDDEISSVFSSFETEETIPNMDDVNHFEEITEEINPLLSKLEQLKFNKIVKSKYSLVQDVLFEQTAEQNNISKRLYQIQKDNFGTIKKSPNLVVKLTFLVIGLQRTGKETFIETFMEHYKVNKVEPEVKIINGYPLKIYCFQIESIYYKFLLFSHPTYKEIPLISDFSSKEIKESSQDFLSYNIRKTELLDGNDDFATTSPISTINRSTNAGFITEEDKLNGSKPIPKYFKLLGIEKDQVKMSKEFPNTEKSKNRPFCWNELDWLITYLDFFPIFFQFFQ